jgi:two-component system OmpR family response regulator
MGLSMPTGPHTDGGSPDEVLFYADLALDRERHEVFRGDTKVELTATEFNLLQYFMLHPGRVLSRTRIIEDVWDDDFHGSRNVVERYVSYLRQKLDVGGPPLIHTVRQAGYVLDAGDD